MWGRLLLVGTLSLICAQGMTKEFLFRTAYDSCFNNIIHVAPFGKRIMATCTDGQALIEPLGDGILKLYFLDGGNCTDLLEKLWVANACILGAHNVTINTTQNYAHVVPLMADDGFNLSCVLDRVCRLLSLDFGGKDIIAYVDERITLSLECDDACAPTTTQSTTQMTSVKSTTTSPMTTTVPTTTTVPATTTIPETTTALATTPVPTTGTTSVPATSAVVAIAMTDPSTVKAFSSLAPTTGQTLLESMLDTNGTYSSEKGTTSAIKATISTSPSKQTAHGINESTISANQSANSSSQSAEGQSGALNEGGMGEYYEDSHEEMEQIKDSRNRYGKEPSFIAVMTLYSFTICYLVFMNIAVVVLKYGCKPFHSVQNRAQRVNKSKHAN